MSIKNMLTAAIFKTDDAGRTVMYPNGAMGRGFILPDAATDQKMRRRFLWLMVGSGLFGGIGMQVMLMAYGQVYEWTTEPWAIAVGSIVVFGIAYHIAAKLFTRGMMPSDQRMGTVEALRRQAEAMPRWYLWFITILAPLMIFGAAWWIVDDRSVMSLAFGLVGLLLFGAIMAQAIYGLRHRARA